MVIIFRLRPGVGQEPLPSGGGHRIPRRHEIAADRHSSADSVDSMDSMGSVDSAHVLT